MLGIERHSYFIPAYVKSPNSDNGCNIVLLSGEIVTKSTPKIIGEDCFNVLITVPHDSLDKIRQRLSCAAYKIGHSALTYAGPNNTSRAHGNAIMYGSRMLCPVCGDQCAAYRVKQTRDILLEGGSLQRKISDEVNHLDDCEFDQTSYDHRAIVRQIACKYWLIQDLFSFRGITSRSKSRSPF